MEAIAAEMGIPGCLAHSSSSGLDCTVRIGRRADGRTDRGVREGGGGWGRQVDWLAGSAELINRILCARSRHAGIAAVPVRV